MTWKSDLDWTHIGVFLSDIRKLKNLYLIQLGVNLKEGINEFVRDFKSGEYIGDPMTVNSSIFEERVMAYFLKDISQISREEILSVRWNFYIKRGEICKISDNNLVCYPMAKDKYYISFLEIYGPLASFDSILAKNKQ